MQNFVNKLIQPFFTSFSSLFSFSFIFLDKKQQRLEFLRILSHKFEYLYHIYGFQAMKLNFTRGSNIHTQKIDRMGLAKKILTCLHTSLHARTLRGEHTFFPPKNFSKGRKNYRITIFKIMCNICSTNSSLRW